jgi:hypothetical protein
VKAIQRWQASEALSELLVEAWATWLESEATRLLRPPPGDHQTDEDAVYDAAWRSGADDAIRGFARRFGILVPDKTDTYRYAIAKLRETLEDRTDPTDDAIRAYLEEREQRIASGDPRIRF